MLNEELPVKTDAEIKERTFTRTTDHAPVIPENHISLAAAIVTILIAINQVKI